MSPVEQDDAVFRIQSCGQIQRTAADQVQGQVRECRAGSKFFCQFHNLDYADMNKYTSVYNIPERAAVCNSATVIAPPGRVNLT